MFIQTVMFKKTYSLDFFWSEICFVIYSYIDFYKYHVWLIAIHRVSYLEWLRCEVFMITSYLALYSCPLCDNDGHVLHPYWNFSLTLGWDDLKLFLSGSANHKNHSEQVRLFATKFHQAAKPARLYFHMRESWRNIS